MSGKFRIVEHLMAPPETKKCKTELSISTSACTPGAEGGDCAKKPTVSGERIGGSGDNNCQCEDGHFPAVFTEGRAGYKVLCPESKPVQNDCTRWSGNDKTKCCTANPFQTETNSAGVRVNIKNRNNNNIKPKGC